MTQRDRDEEAFAVVRVDLFAVQGDSTNWRTALTVKEIVWAQQDAESETSRLNSLNSDKGCIYLWQRTRSRTR